MGRGECCEILYKSTEVMTQRNEGAYHWLYIFKDTPAVKQTNGESGHETPQRIANDAYFLDIASVLRQLFQLIFYLTGEPLPTSIDTIVCEATSVTGSDQDFELIFRKPFSQGSAEILQMRRVAP